MTAYNREKYIAEAIESVINSTYSNWELIIVDDGSKDKTVSIAKHYKSLDSRIKVFVNEENLGDYPNRNRAASYASGVYITYVDSDDTIFPHSLQVMINAVIIYAEAALYMAVRSIDKPLKDFQFLNPKDAYEMHFKDNGFMATGPLGVLIKRSVFNSVEGFSGKRMIGDTEFWLKVAKNHSVVRLEKDLVFWRRHDEQEFNDGFKYYLIDELRMFKDILVDTISPLGKIEGELFYRKIRKSKYISLFKFLIKTGRLRESYSYFKALKLIG
jgi:glycosyltransferase involved in cell wall biosynthesis